MEHSNKIFKDQCTVEALVLTSGDTNLSRYCVDSANLLMIAHDPFTTVSEGMASEAVAITAD